MKKTVLVALLAIVSCASIQAYKININNETKKKHGTATAFRISFFSNNELARKPYVLKPNQKKAFKFKSKKFTITAIRVTGVDGLGDTKTAFFDIPQKRLNRDLNLIIDLQLDNDEVDLLFDQKEVIKMALDEDKK